MIWARIEERDVDYKKYNCNGELLVIIFDVVLGGNQILFAQLQMLSFSFRHIMDGTITKSYHLQGRLILT